MEYLALIAVLMATAAAAALTLRLRAEPLRAPILTVAVAAVTVAVSAAGELLPPVLDALARDQTALGDGQWWRILSPLLVQDGGWPGTVFNSVALLIVGTLAESLVGRVAWGTVYLVCGLAGEVAAYTFASGQGFAGNSIAVVGLAAMVAVVIVVAGPVPARALAAVSLAAGIGLFVAGDLHGVAFCAGALAGVVVVEAAPPGPRGASPGRRHGVR